jgi:osmotically inducible protein OsmC
LDTVAEVPDIDEYEFQDIAEAAKNGCPISKLLRPGVSDIIFSAKLR